MKLITNQLQKILGGRTYGQFSHTLVKGETYKFGQVSNPLKSDSITYLGDGKYYFLDESSDVKQMTSYSTNWGFNIKSTFESTSYFRYTLTFDKSLDQLKIEGIFGV